MSRTSKQPDYGKSNNSLSKFHTKTRNPIKVDTMDVSRIEAGTL